MPELGVATLRELFQVVKAAYDQGDSKPIQDWYGAIRLIFAPALLNEAEALVKEVSNGDPTPVGWESLSFLALGNDSAGPAKVVSYLEPVADRESAGARPVDGRQRRVLRGASHGIVAPSLRRRAAVQPQ
mgnify:CR=1 FL=1